MIIKPDHPLYEETCKKISEAALKRSDKISAIVKKLHSENRCGMRGKKQSDHQKRTVSEAMKGKKKSLNHVLKQQESLMKTLTDPNYTHPNKNKPKPKRECPHCYKFIDNGNYKRYHGENCKLKYEDYVSPHTA